MPDSHKIAELLKSPEWLWIKNHFCDRYAETLRGIQCMTFDAHKIARLLGKSDVFCELTTGDFSRELIEKARKEEAQEEDE